MTWQTHICDADGMSIFYVDANPKISISIPVDLPERSDGTAKIIDVCYLDALKSKFSSPAAGEATTDGGRGPLS